MTAEAPDLDPIVPAERKLLFGGIQVRVKRLRTREVFSLARVLSVGFSRGLIELDVDVADAEGLKQVATGVILTALPYAEEQALAFFRDVLDPVNDDDDTVTRLRAELFNPDPGDLIDVLEVLVDQEADDLFGLLGKARPLAKKMLRVARKSSPDGPDGPGPERST